MPLFNRPVSHTSSSTPAHLWELEITVPSKDDDTGPKMRIYDPPHEALKLEEDICDVEYRQQPAVSIALEIQVFLHTGNFGIANVGAIEEGEKICRGTSVLSTMFTEI